MKVSVIQCGPPANESEQKAIEHLRQRLTAEPGDDHWFLLTNLTFAVTHRMQADEIDIVALGPQGVRLVEVKHWNAEWADRAYDLEREADLVASKARKVGTTLRKTCTELPRIDGSFLLTQEPAKIKRLVGQTVRGVTFYGLSGWKEALGLNGSQVLESEWVKRMVEALSPRSRVHIDGGLRRFAGYVNLELQTDRAARFHRVYRGSHPTRRDRAIIHVYDLSATDEKSAAAKARREFDALHRLQLYPWAPRILDSFQDAPGFPGEMCFFTVVDPAAPTLEDRRDDSAWEARDRVEFARNVIRAVSELHGAQANAEQLVHRNLSPRTILVRHDNQPILTGFERTRIPSEASVASGHALADQPDGLVAPEVNSGGLGAADARSDVFSVCAALQTLFDGDAEHVAEQAVQILASGTNPDPQERAALELISQELSALLGESAPRAPAPPSRFWTEGQVVPFHDHEYRIVNSLGSGGVGTAFKVVEVDRTTREDLGTYVGKVVRDQERGRQTLRAYKLARSHLGRHPGLSAIFEVAKDWQENGFVSLMTWVEGTPLAEFTGVFQLLAEDLQEESAGALALRWVASSCDALGVLHRNGLVHGDVSPRNLIVSGSDLVLTDFDFVAKTGELVSSPGTILYSAPGESERRASPSDDLYALAASLFHVVYDREPFRYAGHYEKERGLNWEGIDEGQYPLLNAFLRRATDPNRDKRFSSMEEVAKFLARPGSPVPPSVPPLPSPAPAAVTLPVLPAAALHENHVPWLKDVLRSYPGYPGGNQETRGLDTAFALSTYVETSLEQTLLRDIRARRVRLVVLCGNAGDGKTALLQHLAQQLGLGKHASADRILEGRLGDGLVVRMNLDGSASWKGRSADELLDGFLAPFHAGEPSQDIVHLLAINDGRLLEWVEGHEARSDNQPSLLTQALSQLLERGSSRTTGHIRFISLNQRSLVGDVTAGGTAIVTEFLDRLVDQLYGGTEAKTVWRPCASCSAQTRCGVFAAGRLFAPEGFPARASDASCRRARERLAEALQAAHLRGEIHITVRELRAALVYILFGVQYCDAYHAADAQGHTAYWDRAFDADSPLRQGELLRELLRFDPALEAHPQIDRHLSSQPLADAPPSAPRYPGLTVESARRRAYFEWTQSDLALVGRDCDSLELARGRHLRNFRDLALFDEARRRSICRDLCRGISRLEDLPPPALDREGVIPLRVTPRTPTESAFWVEKPLDSFRLDATLPEQAQGIERLHRQAVLTYRYRDGRLETLRLGAELFHLLLELGDGYQLGDVSTDDAFSNLSVFVQRLVQEDARELLVWNPMADETIFRVTTDTDGKEGTPRKRLAIRAIHSGGTR